MDEEGVNFFVSAETANLAVAAFRGRKFTRETV
jgi:hypothetical protein